MKEADVILTSITQTDGQVKNRPAIILRKMPRYRDVLICGVSTQLQQYIANFDEIITPNDPDFISSGLVSQSVIRLSFLAVIPQSSIIGVIGSIAFERHRRLLHNLSNYLINQS